MPKTKQPKPLPYTLVLRKSKRTIDMLKQNSIDFSDLFLSGKYITVELAPTPRRHAYPSGVKPRKLLSYEDASTVLFMLANIGYQQAQEYLATKL